MASGKVVGDTVWVPTLTGEAAKALDEEMARAREKFPGNRFLYTALGEEFGELGRAFLQRESEARIKKEALQVACVAMRIFLEGDPTYDDLTEEEAKP